MAVLAKVKENPMVTAAITIALLAGGVTGAVQMWGVLDRTHVTEAELLVYDLKAHTFASQQFAALELSIEEIALTSKCRWLKSEIRALKDAIYVRRRDGADADHINDLEGDLDELEDDYDALRCAALLA